jgi:hypothetical protein
LRSSVLLGVALGRIPDVIVLACLQPQPLADRVAVVAARPLAVPVVRLAVGSVDEVPRLALAAGLLCPACNINSGAQQSGTASVLPLDRFASGAKAVGTAVCAALTVHERAVHDDRGALSHTQRSKRHSVAGHSRARPLARAHATRKESRGTPIAGGRATRRTGASGLPSPKKTEPGSRASFHKPWKPPRSITEYCDLGSVIRSPTVPSRPFMSAAAHSRAAYAVSVGGGGQRQTAGRLFQGGVGVCACVWWVGGGGRGAAAQ